MTKRKWEVLNEIKLQTANFKLADLIKLLLSNRGLTSQKAIDGFLHPSDPYSHTAKDVGISSPAMKKALTRIEKAIIQKESIVVYADYDADGVTAGAIMWETLYLLGANVMPYIPHRVEEGYGLSAKGIDNVKNQYNPILIITVDHGITAWERVAYAKKLGIDVIVTDHHVKPKRLPVCTIVHTTELCGAGVAWFVAKELGQRSKITDQSFKDELLALAAMGTVADMVPLIGANRAIVKYGLEAINKTVRVGLLALIKDAVLKQGEIGTYEISHLLAPRLNAMGRLEHAMDALRLLCTKKEEKAKMIAETLGLTNRERQQLTEETTLHAKVIIKALSEKRQALKKLLFVAHGDYNQGVIGLVAGKLVETYYRPAIVVAKGELVSKASARSITGFNIIDAIRSCMDILVDAGGHPMAAGFTIETAKLDLLQNRLEELAEKELNEEKLTRVLKIDTEIPLEMVTDKLWGELREFEPFGIGNPEPVFASRGVAIKDARLVGREAKHLKLKLTTNNLQPTTFDTIGFGMGDLYSQLSPNNPIDVAYTIDMNTWNGNNKLQLKLKDIHLT